MTTMNASWIKHPGHYLKEEMEERGWMQRDLAFVLGCSEQAVNLILSGKRGISPEMAKALGDAFDIDPDTFANLQKAYDMAHADDPDPGVTVRAKMQNRYPVREMIMRGWIEPSDAAMLGTQLMRFFEVPNPEAIPYLDYASYGKKSRYEEKEVPPIELAWLFRVKQLAKSMSVPKYSESALRKALNDLQGLLYAPEEARQVPRILTECGVRYVLVEKLPQAEIDGVCFWLDDSPVIGMSTRRDKIDNFWFVLRHEIEHALQKHGQAKNEEMIDWNLEGVRASSTNSTLPPEERVANAAAANFCVPSEKLDSFMKRKHPFYYEKDVIGLARTLNRHPGLVVGQMQFRMDRYDYLARHLVKIRQFVLPGSIADGWGHIASVSL